MSSYDADELDRKARKVETLPYTQRDTLMDTCAVLVDLEASALEFVEIVAIESEKSKPFDPLVVMANALARWKALRKRN